MPSGTVMVAPFEEADSSFAVTIDVRPPFVFPTGAESPACCILKVVSALACFWMTGRLRRRALMNQLLICYTC